MGLSNLERLEKIIAILDNYATQLLIDGHAQWADTVSTITRDLQWLYRDMSRFG